MGELLRRLGRQPAATARLLLVSLLINVLGLAPSLYVIQVLNRYVGHGVNATLATLTAGAVIAAIAEHAFRTVRLDLAREVVGDGDERMATGLFGLLLTARLADLDARPRGEGEELMRGVEQAETAFGAANLAALADVPFSLLFLVVLALLSPPLAGVAAVFAVTVTLLTWLGQRRLEVPVRIAQTAQHWAASLLGAATSSADAIRQFGGARLLMERWQDASGKARGWRSHIATLSNDAGSLSQVAQGLMGVATTAVGAMLVVDGHLDVGALIGANLIAARALAPIVRLAQMSKAMKQGESALQSARQFASQVAVEPAGGLVMAKYHGSLTLAGLGYTPPGHAKPVFAGIDLSLPPGGVLVVTGRNGTGKSSLVRLIVGLALPTFGQVQADGVDVARLSPGWWRSQVAYLPQEPLFIDGSVRDNLAATRPNADEADMRRCLAMADLLPFVDEHPDGLDRVIPLGGRTLASGLRRRLALARALMIDAPLVVMDEPSDGLDREGGAVVYNLLIELARRGRTIVVVSHDPNILRGAQVVLELGPTGARLGRADNAA